MDEGLIKVVVLLLVGAFVLIGKVVEAARAYRRANIEKREREDRPPLHFDAPVVPPSVATIPTLAPPRPPRRPKRRRRKPAPPQQSLQPVAKVVKPRRRVAAVPAVVSRPVRRGWDQKKLREAIVLREILGPPKALRHVRR